MRPARLERATYSFGGCHSIQLSYGRSVVASIAGRPRKLNPGRCKFLIVLVILVVLEDQE